MLPKIFMRKPKPGTKAFRDEMARRIAGQHIRYVTERVDNVENVIGRRTFIFDIENSCKNCGVGRMGAAFS